MEGRRGVWVVLHFHVIVLDGVFADHADGTLRFHAAPTPTDAEVVRLVAKIRRRVLRHLARQAHQHRVARTRWSSRRAVSHSGQLALGVHSTGVAAASRVMANRRRSRCKSAKTQASPPGLRSAFGGQRADHDHQAASRRVTSAQRNVRATEPETDRTVRSHRAAPAGVSRTSARARRRAGVRGRCVPRLPSLRHHGARPVSLSLQRLPQ